MNGQFLVAKYIRDLERGEPRNIGVIVWTPGKTACRFVDPDDLEEIEDVDNFVRWVTYWEELASSPRIEVFNLKAATNKTPRFLKVLQKTQRGNYALEDGGEVLDEVTDGNIDDVVSFLFHRIVQRTPQAGESTREPTIKQKCRDLFTEIGATQINGFSSRYPVSIEVGEFKQDIHFDFGFGNGKPSSLFQAVNIQREESVALATGKINTSKSFASVQSADYYCLYDSGNEEDGFTGNVSLLDRFSTTLDIADIVSASEKLLRVLVADH